MMVLSPSPYSRDTLLWYNALRIKRGGLRRRPSKEGCAAYGEEMDKLRWAVSHLRVPSDIPGRWGPKGGILEEVTAREQVLMIGVEMVSSSQ